MYKIKKISKYLTRKSYIKVYKKTYVHDNYIFLESQHGKNINGNIFYILKELSSNEIYKDFCLFLGVEENEVQRVKSLFRSYKISNVNLLVLGSKDYYIKLSESKFLFNDTSFLPFFIKKEKQIYINTWHGTPLKTLGRHVKNDFYRIGNVQKNFIESDYIIAPNSFFKEKILDSFMIGPLFKGKFLLSGYPRNIVFFENESAKRIKKEMNLEGKKIYAYMPTWRGKVGNVTKEIDLYLSQLKEIDNHLTDEQYLFVNLHPFVSSHINLETLNHVFLFPNQYETYDFLNVVDCLITDYSSVFFDFANTKRKIIIFNYDEKDYCNERGLYLSLDDLPFPKVNSIEQLVVEMNSDIKYDSDEFLHKYCAYDNADATKKLCQHVILNNKNIKEERLNNNGKKNILIFAGRLVNNGITTSLLNLMNCVDTRKYNIYISFSPRNADLAKDNILRLPNNIYFYPHFGKKNTTIEEFIYEIRYHYKLVNKRKSIKKMKEIFKYEVYRMFGHAQFDEVIHFSGYGFKTIWLYSQFPCHRSIYVHNDMVQEIKQRHNQNIYALEYAYQTYDKVAIVTEDIRKSTIQISHISNNICLCNNIIDYKNIQLKGLENIKVEERTEMSCSLNELIEKLDSKKFKFVNVGRFSVEKGHFRLIDAFEKFHEQYEDTMLIIIGGDGALYTKTKEYVKNKSCGKDIILIKNVLNPLPIVKRCNGFILSSLYEGFGLVLVEANILGLPIVSTDITGPRGFMNKYNGKLVENSEKGIYIGLEELYNSQIENIKVDYEKYNETAIKQFYNLIDE